jgi:ribosome-associated toxin RatA of RatAB toxin-antitoxin module
VQAVEDRILIHAPAEALFDLAQDYALRLEWDPFLREMRFLDGASVAAVGVKVWVRAWTGLTMTVEYISLDRPHVVAMKMLRGPWFFRAFAGTWRFVEQTSGTTEVVFRYAFETRWRGGWSRWMLDPLIRVVFRRDIRARLRGLKRGAEEKGLLQRLPGVSVRLLAEQGVR